MRSVKQTPLSITSLIRYVFYIKDIATLTEVGDASVLYIDNSKSPIKTYLYNTTQKQYVLFDDGGNSPISKVKYFVYRRDFPLDGSTDEFYIETGVSTHKCYVRSHYTQQYIQIPELVKEPALYTTNPIKIMNNRCVLPNVPLGNIVWNMALIFDDLTAADLAADGSLKSDRDYVVSECVGFTLNGRAITFAQTDRSFLNNKYAVFTYLARPE